MFDTDFTYPIDGVVKARPLAARQYDLIRGQTMAMVTAHKKDESGPPIGRVVTTMHNSDWFRCDDAPSYTYRYFLGATLNTHSLQGTPVMVLGPHDSDLPWVVGRVADRRTDFVSVNPLWGPIGATLPTVMTGDAWVRVAATPPAALLYHPDDDQDVQIVKQDARNAWLRFRAAWLALLGETSLRGWSEALTQIAEAAEYTPEEIDWLLHGRIQHVTTLARAFSPEDREALTRQYGADYLSGTTATAAVVGTTALDITVRSKFVPHPGGDPGVRTRFAEALHQVHPYSELVGDPAVTATPSTL